ncbi:hypothetical protein [Pararhodobacter zhoushanensis]|uniref:hypothetical protein n=1 Tax=Pararhodobacter zhoushanensis TaxID=2479545 RepID=UPI000F8EAA4D|nr:hypothetical protein [Pararhodobacter zhoushanensis]
MASPVALTAETVNPSANPAARIAPFVAGFATALAAMVGAIIGWVGTRGLGSLRALRLRVIFAVVAMPVAALVMASIVTGFAGGAFVGLWLAIALLGIAFGWFAAGALALVGPVALLVLVPLVFWQAVLGGAQVQMTAAPVWLHWLAPLGIDQIGAHYRSLIIAGGHPFPWGLAAGAAVLGLGMLILRALLVRGRIPVTA